MESSPQTDRCVRAGTVAPLILGLCAAAPVEIPTVGRPGVDFYGAAGSGVTVSFAVEPEEVTLGEAFHARLVIDNVANPGEVRRPDPAGLPEFEGSFRVEDDPDRPGDTSPGRRVFRYRLFPRSAEVTRVPTFWFAYFDPKLKGGTADPTKWFPLAWSEPVPVAVRPPAEDARPAVPLSVPDFAATVTPVELDGGSMHLTWPLIAAVLTLPPVIATAALWLWRRLDPDAERLARHRQSRAARRALGRLAGLRRRPGDDPATAAVRVMSEYVDDRFASATPEPLAEWFRAADAARFAPSGGNDVGPLLAEAGRLIGRLEGGR